MDENGIMLSVQEVRERLRDGRPVILNEEANWNNQQKITGIGIDGLTTEVLDQYTENGITVIKTKPID